MRLLVGAALLAWGAPAAAAPAARVAGRATRNGQPVSGLLVKLSRAAHGAHPVEVATDAQGRFAAAALIPGRYGLLARVVVPGRVDCRPSAPGLSIHTLVGPDPRGRTVTLATVLLLAPLELEPGQSVTRDIALSCRPAPAVP